MLTRRVRSCLPRAGALGALLLLNIACGADAGESTGVADAGAGGVSPQSGGTGGVPAPGGSGGAGGEATGGTPMPAGCDPVDAVCPGARPLVGTPCVSGLSCVYEPTRADPARFTLTCPDGRWLEDINCDEAGVGALTVEVGPDAPGEDFRPFTAGETVTQVVGGQGSPMLPFRVRVSGGDPEAALTCVELGTQLREAAPPGGAAESSEPAHPVRHVHASVHRGSAGALRSSSVRRGPDGLAHGRSVDDGASDDPGQPAGWESVLAVCELTG